MSIIKVDYGDIASGGGDIVINEEYVKNIVMNNTLDYTWTKMDTYTTVIEGGIYIDRTNHIIYCYGKFKRSTATSSTLSKMIKETPQMTGTSSDPLLHCNANQYENVNGLYPLLLGDTHPTGSNPVFGLHSALDSNNNRYMFVEVRSGGLVANAEYSFYGMWTHNYY